MPEYTIYAKKRGERQYHRSTGQTWPSRQSAEYALDEFSDKLPYAQFKIVCLPARDKGFVGLVAKKPAKRPVG